MQPTEEQLQLEGVDVPVEDTTEQAAASQTLEEMAPEEIHKAVVLNAFDQTNLLGEILTTMKIVAQQQSALIQYLMK